MVAYDRRTPRVGGFSITHALVAVVMLGVGATVAIPRLVDARAQARDEKATAALERIRDEVDVFRQRHGRVPADLGDLDLDVPADIIITLWTRQVVGGEEVVHIHLKHDKSRRTFHLLHPRENRITPLPEDWVRH